MRPFWQMGISIIFFKCMHIKDKGANFTINLDCIGNLLFLHSSAKTVEKILDQFIYKIKMGKRWSS